MEQFSKYAGVNQMICTISRNMRTLYLVCEAVIFEVFNYLVIQYFLNIKKYVFYQKCYDAGSWQLSYLTLLMQSKYFGNLDSKVTSVVRSERIKL